jgi:hypothetical protein
MAGDNARPVDSKKRTGFGPHSSPWHSLDLALLDAYRRMAETHASTARQPYPHRFLSEKADRFWSALFAVTLSTITMPMCSRPYTVLFACGHSFYPSSRQIVLFDRFKIFERLL